MPLIQAQAGEQRRAMQDTYMTNRLAGITIDCADPARLGSFWSALLDITVTGEHGDDAGCGHRRVTPGSPAAADLPAGAGAENH